MKQFSDHQTLKPAEGIWKGGEFSFPIRVYYEDTDLGGMVYHPRYVSFFERVRTESIRSLKGNIDALLSIPAEEGGPVVYVVRNINITYHRQSTINDILIGTSRISRVRAAALEMTQRLVNDQGQLVAEAIVLVAIIDKNGKPKRWPEDMKVEWQQLYDDYISAEGKK